MKTSFICCWMHGNTLRSIEGVGRRTRDSELRTKDEGAGDVPNKWVNIYKLDEIGPTAAKMWLLGRGHLFFTASP